MKLTAFELELVALMAELEMKLEAFEDVCCLDTPNSTEAKEELHECVKELPEKILQAHNTA